MRFSSLGVERSRRNRTFDWQPCRWTNGNGTNFYKPKDLWWWYSSRSKREIKRGIGKNMVCSDCWDSENPENGNYRLREQCKARDSNKGGFNKRKKKRVDTDRQLMRLGMNRGQVETSWKTAVWTGWKGREESCWWCCPASQCQSSSVNVLLC